MNTLSDLLESLSDFVGPYLETGSTPYMFEERCAACGKRIDEVTNVNAVYLNEVDVVACYCLCDACAITLRDSSKKWVAKLHATIEESLLKAYLDMKARSKSGLYGAGGRPL